MTGIVSVPLYLSLSIPSHGLDDIGQPQSHEVFPSRDAVVGPVAQPIELIKHPIQFVRWAIAPLRGTEGDGFMHDTIRQQVILAPHPFTHVKGPLQVDNALTDALEIFRRHAKSGD